MISPQIKALLNAIGSKEAPKGYNQIYTPAEKIVGFPKLTSMTLAEVRALQGRMLKGGAASTAVGRYQFLRKTLDATRTEMGLATSAVWTPDLQDRMAVHLMEARGLSRYLKGKMSRETFANNLAKEWASLPVVTPINGKKPGQSYYAGDGLNASFHSPAKILKLIDALKASPVALVSPPAPEQPGPETANGGPSAGPETAIQDNDPFITPQSGDLLIKALQAELKAKHYYDGLVDGNWTDESLTDDAVALLQKRNGLEVGVDAIRLSDVRAAKPYIVATRVDATVETLKERGDPATTFFGRVKAAAKWALGAVGLGGSAAAVNSDAPKEGVIDKASDTLSLLERGQALVAPVATPLADTFFFVLHWIWVPVFIGLPIAWLWSRHAEQKRLAAFKTGAA